MVAWAYQQRAAEAKLTRRLKPGAFFFKHMKVGTFG